MIIDSKQDGGIEQPFDAGQRTGRFEFGRLRRSPGISVIGTIESWNCSPRRSGPRNESDPSANSTRARFLQSGHTAWHRQGPPGGGFLPTRPFVVGIIPKDDSAQVVGLIAPARTIFSSGRNRRLKATGTMIRRWFQTMMRSLLGTKYPGALLVGLGSDPGRPFVVGNAHVGPAIEARCFATT